MNWEIRGRTQSILLLAAILLASSRPVLGQGSLGTPTSSAGAGGGAVASEPGAAGSAKLASPIEQGQPYADPAPPTISDDGGLNCVGFDWKKSKYRYQKFFWPSGFPTNVPAGPGYYSLRDQCQGNYRETAPPGGYPRFFLVPQGFADVDFSYVDDPKNQPDFLESLHRVYLGNDWRFGTGGEERNKTQLEDNSRLTGKVNDYNLNRLRIFGEVWYQDKFRVYAEFLDARSSSQTLTPLASDQDHADFLNLFVDLKTFMIGDEAVYTRMGRQQILLGSQRYISPLDWANAPRTFDGVRMTRRSDKFDVDLFWLRPVIPNADKFDSSDNHQNFAGIYTTYRPAKNQILDLYYLYLSNHDTPATAKANAVGALNVDVPYDIHTLGFRLAGRNEQGFLWDSENVMQMGTHNNNSVLAGSFTNGVGYHFQDRPLNPTFWIYYDYATGSNSVGGTNTFNQIYPLGHYYLGWIDYIGRSNIQDLNLHMYLYPTNWITFNTQYHMFHLANNRDALYNTADTVIRSDPTGKSGGNVGSELDLTCNFHVTKHTDILVGYAQFFAGSFVRDTGAYHNTNTVYLLYNYRW